MWKVIIGKYIYCNATFYYTKRINNSLWISSNIFLNKLDEQLLSNIWFNLVIFLYFAYFPKLDVYIFQKYKWKVRYAQILVCWAQLITRCLFNVFMGVLYCILERMIYVCSVLRSYIIEVVPRKVSK